MTIAPRTGELSASSARRTTSAYHAGKSVDCLGNASIVLSFVDVWRRGGGAALRAEARERLRRHAHEGRPRGDRRTGRKRIHTRPQRRHAAEDSQERKRARRLRGGPASRSTPTPASRARAGEVLRSEDVHV